jgi:hypothetical protein
MNKDKMIELLEDGAYFDLLDEKFFHPSFRKGWRKITSGNISWWAVKRYYSNSGRLVSTEKLVYSLAKDI